MTWEIRELALQGGLFEGAIRVYGDAFREPPYSDDNRGREVSERLRGLHSRRPGYRGLVAVEGSTAVGMAYGYRGERGQWWHDAVRGSMRDAADRWLDDSYELVEIAVSPRRQGRGIGASLIEVLLAGRPEATCVLSTRTDSRAHHLYSRLGFEVVHTMAFAPGAAPFYIMGCDLKRFAARLGGPPERAGGQLSAGLERG